jgi:hypothetical protein
VVAGLVGVVAVGDLPAERSGVVPAVVLDRDEQCGLDGGDPGVRGLPAGRARLGADQGGQRGVEDAGHLGEQADARVGLPVAALELLHPGKAPPQPGNAKFLAILAA